VNIDYWLAYQRLHSSVRGLLVELEILDTPPLHETWTDNKYSLQGMLADWVNDMLSSS